jgi:hypothetical protein
LPDDDWVVLVDNIVVEMLIWAAALPEERNMRCPTKSKSDVAVRL